MSIGAVPKEIRTLFGGAVILCGALWGSAITSGNVVVTILTVVLTLLLIFVLLFFRDPERTVPDGENNIVAPCDGRVLSIEPCPKEVLGIPGQVITIFMTLFNVHVNRNVCSGKVLVVEHKSGNFGHAGKNQASKLNEQNCILIENSQFRVSVTQIAGMLARRIICKLQPGDTIEKGERFGMIILGSRLEVTLPETVEIKVAVGQKVRAGETIIGVYHP